jgi:hypothetical protein
VHSAAEFGGREGGFGGDLGVVIVAELQAMARSRRSTGLRPRQKGSAVVIDRELGCGSWRFLCRAPGFRFRKADF